MVDEGGYLFAPEDYEPFMRLLKRQGILSPDNIIDTWCHIHGPRTPHRWQPGAPHPLTCLVCMPESHPQVGNILTTSREKESEA